MTSKADTSNNNTTTIPPTTLTSLINAEMMSNLYASIDTHGIILPMLQQQQDQQRSLRDVLDMALYICETPSFDMESPDMMRLNNILYNSRRRGDEQHRVEDDNDETTTTKKSSPSQ